MSSPLPQLVNTFGQDLKRRHGMRVHKLAINAGLTCPNRDGSKGRGGCTFCNNVSFSPNARKQPDVAQQIEAGRQVIARRTGARRFIAYFQAYTNTYADIARLRQLYDAALAQPDVIGLSVGTRPDCVPDTVLDLLCAYHWPGNVRELENVLMKAVALCPGDAITVDLIPGDIVGVHGPALQLEVPAFFIELLDPEATGIPVDVPVSLQLLGELLEPIPTTRGEDAGDALACESACELGADSR